MGRLTPYARRRVLVLRQEFKTIKKLRLALLADDISITRQNLSYFLKRYDETESVADRPRSGRTPSLDLEHLDFIDNSLHENPELSARDLQRKLSNTFNVNVCLTTIKRKRRNIGWVYTGTRYAQLIRHINRPLRETFCLHSLGVGDRFGDVIFSDECSVPIGASLRKCFRKRGEPRILVSKPKHPLKVHVWAGISARGPTDICIFRGIMDSEFYQEVLESHLLPFIHHVYPEGHRFQQDNDPKHVSRQTLEWMRNNGINYWPTPPESPDLNPIENIWAGLKHHIFKTVKPTIEEELLQGIKDFWATVTPVICQKYINHLHKVMPVVITRAGAASGF